MNRFFDIPSVLCEELLPWEIRRLGLPDDRGQYRLRQRGGLRMRSDIAGGVIVVPEDRISDLASVPGLVKPVIDDDSPIIAAGAWVHDEGYRNLGVLQLADGWAVTVSRQQMDAILAFECMADLGAPKWKQHAVYQALRRFGDGWEKDSFWERLT